MAKKFFSYDPTTGLLTTTADEDGKTYFGYEQDVSASLDMAAEIRNSRDSWHSRTEEDIHHVAFVPDSVILKMRFEDKVDFYDKDQQKAVMKLIQTKYPKCLTTNKRIA